MPGRLIAGITRLFQTRDELSFRNIRGGLWPLALVFPLSVIMGNSRYYDHSIALAGFKSFELMFFLLGFGWLVTALTPERLIISFLKAAALVSAILLPFQIFMPSGLLRVELYLALKFFNGLSAACAFYLFCFALNNVERLFGMALIQFYYGFYYTALRSFPVIQAASETYGGVAVMAVFLVVVFSCRPERWSKLNLEINTAGNGKGSGVLFVIGLDIVYYIIMCMLNYIEWSENSLSSFAFGIGTFISIGLVLIIQLLKGKSALYIWFSFLALSLLGLGALLYDKPATFIFGSFAYGLGDGLGYIIIYYMCAGAIKKSKSMRMWRFYCLTFFAEYIVISGFFSYYFQYFEEPNKFLAFGVVVVLVSVSLLLLPLLQKKLFDADWTDGLYLRDMVDYSRPFTETEKLNVKDNLNLTAREEEVFTMLLKGSAPKEIAFILKISNYTVHFHQKNLYRKLGIQSRAELFARYLSKTALQNSNGKVFTGVTRLNGLDKQLIGEIERLKALSITDELTKINNRRSFFEYMDLIWEHCRRLGLQINVVMIDVDNFKKYNDSLGHLEGDKALIAIAQCLKNQLKKETDHIARLGGEEFVCLLPFTEKKDASLFAKTLVHSVEDMNIPHPKNGHSKYLTISAGMAHIVPNNSNSSAQLLELADKALYAAKKQGRNKLVTN